MSEVSERLGVSAHSLYKWLKQARGNNGRHGKDHEEALRKENLRLKNELKRVEEERDILKRPQRTLSKHPGKVRVYCGAQRGVSHQFNVQGVEGKQKRVLCMAESA